MPPTNDAPKLSAEQWKIVLLIGAVQFVNILDFVMVMPLGPLFAAALQIPASNLGYVGGAYTASACISGLIGSLFLDRFDRRKALAVAMIGLVLGTALGGFAVDLNSLLFARVVAGAFGGPATSLALSIIADAIPPALRGRAMGTVMGAFSVASVVGVPMGLWAAETFGWSAPFFGVSVVGSIVAAGALFLLPPMRGHLNRTTKHVTLFELLADPLVQLSYLMTCLVMIAGFLIIPNIAAFLQLNLGFPSSMLKVAYGVGGVVSLAATQLGGRAVDRFGSFRTGTAGALAAMGVTYAFYVVPHEAGLPVAMVLFFFMAFMLSNGVRNVSYNTLTSKVPEADARARFQSFQSAAQHGASAFAAIASSRMLSTVGTGPQTRLVGMQTVALWSIGLTLLVPVMLFVVERGVRKRALIAGRAVG